MKLQEIKDCLEALAQMEIGEDTDNYFIRVWDSLPRIPYKQLPLSLQKSVRERFTPDALLKFLKNCYPTQEDVIKFNSMPPEEQGYYWMYSPDSYVSFESVTEGIPEDAFDEILIRTRNTAIYTIEGEDPGNPYPVVVTGNIVPSLHGVHAIMAFDAAIEAYREKQEKKQQKREKLEQYEKEKEQAKKDGKELPKKPQQTQWGANLVSTGFYQYVISDKKYQHGLSTQQNKNAYIALMQPEFFKRFDFADGTLTFDKETAGIVKQYKKGKYSDIQNLDLPLLTQIYTAAVKSNIRHDAFTITVSLPKFFQEMGIEMSKGNAPDIMAKLHSFENCVGIMPETGIVAKLFTILQLDTQNQTMTFAVPYIMRLLETLEEKNHIERKTRQGELIDYTKPYNHAIVHGVIAKERNKTAIQLVYLIINGLVQRGCVPDCQTWDRKNAKTQFPERVTYSIRFSTLINNAPLLRGRIQSYQEIADKNKALRRAFEKAYQLLETKTDVKKYYINLKYNDIIPTMATLDKELTFTHEGKNGDYKPKK